MLTAQVTIGSFTSWIAVVSSLSALIIGLVTAIWAYTRFVVERGLLPPVQFDLECNALGTQVHKWVLEIVLHLKNLGSSALIAKDICVDVRYLDGRISPQPSGNPRRLGRLEFEGSLRADLGTEKDPSEPRRGFRVIPHSTFVQPGVDQGYAFVTAVPVSATYVLVWAEFRYAQSPKGVQRIVLWLSRRLGLIQFTLHHVTEGHSVERAFRIADTGQARDVREDEPERPLQLGRE